MLSQQMRGRGAGRNDDQPIARVERRALAGERDDRVTKRLEIGRLGPAVSRAE